MDSREIPIIKTVTKIQRAVFTIKEGECLAEKYTAAKEITIKPRSSKREYCEIGLSILVVIKANAMGKNVQWTIQSKALRIPNLSDLLLFTSAAILQI